MSAESEMQWMREPRQTPDGRLMALEQPTGPQQMPRPNRSTRHVEDYCGQSIEEPIEDDPLLGVRTQAPLMIGAYGSN